MVPSFCEATDYHRVNNRGDYRSRKSRSARGAATVRSNTSPWRILRRSGSRVSSVLSSYFPFFSGRPAEKSKPVMEIPVLRRPRRKVTVEESARRGEPEKAIAGDFSND